MKFDYCSTYFTQRFMPFKKLLFFERLLCYFCRSVCPDFLLHERKRSCLVIVYKDNLLLSSVRLFYYFESVVVLVFWVWALWRTCCIFSLYRIFHGAQLSAALWLHWQKTFVCWIDPSFGAQNCPGHTDNIGCWDMGPQQRILGQHLLMMPASYTEHRYLVLWERWWQL